MHAAQRVATTFANKIAAAMAMAVFLINGAHAAASMSVTTSTSTSTLTLSTTGSLDWAHWGDGSVPGMNRKATGSIVPNYTTIGSGVATTLTGYGRSMTWTGGSPLATSSGNTSGVQVSGVGSGFKVSLPADAQTRTARIYVYAFNAASTFKSHLSDGSVADYTSNATASSTATTKAYYVTYTANGPSRTLDLTWTMTGGTGSVGLVAVAVPTFTTVNHAPTLVAPSVLQLSVGQSSFFAVTGSDVDGGALVYSSTALPPGMTLNVSTGAVTGTPTTAGTYPVTFTVKDSTNLTATSSSSITVATVASINTAPSNASASFTTPYNTSVTITPSFTDPDVGDSWTYFIETQPAHGSVVIQGSNFVYSPVADYFGPDSFTFRVVDSFGTFATGTASGTITPVAPSQVLAATASQGTVVGAVQLAWSVADGATSYNILRGTSSTDPSPVQIGTSTALTYSDGTGVPGTHYFYSVQSFNTAGTATASPTVMGYSDTPPSAVSATFATGLATQVEVLPVYTDPDPGDSATFAVISQPSNGVATVTANKVYYTPNAAWAGTDSFTFSVTDSHGASATGTATGTVTAPTPAQVGAVTATQGTLLNAVGVSWPAATNALSYKVLRGTTASDPAPLTLGTVTSLTYSDNTAVSGTQYYYSVQSLTIGQSALPSAAVLGYADTVPSGVSATFSATLETATPVTPIYTDPDVGDTATFTIASQPLHGSVAVASNIITYTPSTGYVGNDSFTFTVTDAQGASATGTASGTVTALTPAQVGAVTATQGTLLNSVGVSWPASTNARSYKVLRGVSVSDPSPSTLGTVTTLSYSDNTAVSGAKYYYSVQALTIGKSATPSAAVLGYADTVPSGVSATFAATLETATPVTPIYTDPDAGDTATFTIGTQPAHGSASVASNVITYTPALGYVGNDSFTFTVTDSRGASASGTASGTVTALTPAQVGTVTATQGTLLNSVGLTWPASANARSYKVLRGTTATDPAPATLGTVTTLTYNDATALPGTLYYYAVQALTVGKSALASAAVSGYADTPPSAASASFTAILETAQQVNPVFTDPDAGDTATFAIATQPAHGSVSITGNLITYTPAAAYVGSDSFTFTVTDRAGASVTGTASGTVVALDPVQVASVAATQGSLLGSVQVTWPAATNARSYKVLRGTSSTDPAPVTLGTVTTLSYNDNTAAPGVHSFYSVQSLTIGKAALVSAAVLGFADTPPSAAVANFTTPVEVAAIVTPSFNDPDPSETFTLSIVTPPANGQASVSGSTIIYTPNNGFLGTDTFVFRVTDRAGGSTTGTATGSVVTVSPDPVPGIVATQATRVNSVDVYWSTTANASSYAVYRGVSQNDPAPTLLQTVSGVSYTDSTAVAGQKYYYFVQGKNTYVSGSISTGYLGFADTPPSNLVATFSTLQSQPVMVVPTWTDPDPAETFSLSIVTPPQHGTASVVSGQIRYVPNSNFVGADTFQYSVQDRAGASASGWATGTIQPGIPDAPLAFVVSQGTVLGAVNLDWMNMLGALNYTVQRSELTNDPNAMTIASTSANTFVDLNVTPGATYYYTVSAIGASGTSPPSSEVSGYADTPPSAASANASTVFNTPVTFKPTVVDPDPLDSHKVAIVTPPARGTLAVSSDLLQFIYTPQNGWAGQDTFTFTATDVAGASVTGNGTLSVGCPAPSVAPLAVSQPKLFAGSGFTVSTTYGNTGCPGTLSGLFEVKSGTTVVYSSPVPSLAGVVSAPLSFPVANLQPGSYQISVSVTDPVTNNTTKASLPLTVASFRMPNFTATGSLFENLDIATIGVGTSLDCTLTANRAVALANHAVCYYEVSPIPPGMIEVLPSALPTWTGKISISGNYAPTLSIYQYDDFGVPQLLGSVTRNILVQPLTLMTFASPTSLAVSQYMEQLPIEVKQTFGPPCQITTDRAGAISGTVAGTRMCFLEFAAFSPYQVLNATGVSAPFLVAGNTTVNWTMSAFSASGQQTTFASGSTDVVVTPPDIAYAASTGSTSPIATITRTSVSLVSTGSLTCPLTTNVAKANVTGIVKPCLVEWTNIPVGLAPNLTTDNPLLEGIFKASGQQSVGFTISYFDVSGMKRTLWTASSPIPVDPPPMPQIILKQGNVLGTNIFGVPVTGGYVATLLVDVTKWPVDMTVQWSDEALPQTFRISAMRNTQLIPATAAPLWTRRQATIRLYLRDAPSIFVEQVIDVVSIPRVGVMLSIDSIPITVPDSIPTPLTARVDVRTVVGPLYDSGSMGQWNIQFGQKDVTGAFVPEGAAVATDSNGTSSSTINPFGLVVIRPMARATPISPFTDIKLPYIESPLRVSTVVKGTPIVGTVDIKGLKEGPAPLIGIFRVAFATRPDQLANASVIWFTSTDAGATWVKSDLTGLQIVMRMAEGNYLVKAGFVNRNTGAASESPPVALNVWSVPVITITGPQFAFPGTQTTLNVALKQTTGAPIVAATTEWSVSKRVVLSVGQAAPPPLTTGTGQAINFTATEPGAYLVTVKSRMNTSNPNNVFAWGISQYQVIYGAPERPFANLTGPVRAEVGKTYTFNVNVRTRYNLALTSLTLGGRWTLPDGTVVNGLAPTTYAPTDADLAKAAFVTIKHESWVVGYESTTTTVASLNIPIWKYVWPGWKLTSSVVTTVAPTNVLLTVMPDNLALLPTLEGLTFTWTMPAAMRALIAPGSKLQAIIEFGGTHAVDVTISDARGNATTLSTSLVIGDPKPYIASTTVVNQSKWTHAPLTVGASTVVLGGHPLDAVTSYTYKLNGAPLTLPNRSIVSLTLDQPGTYALEVDIASKMGATANRVTTITVPANVAPACTVTGVPSINRLMVVVTATCQDPDGAITKYEWFVNGVAQNFAVMNKWVYVLPIGTKYPLSIDLTVTDDGAAKTSVHATVN